MANALVTTIEHQTLGKMETRVLAIYAENGIVKPHEIVRIYNETFGEIPNNSKVRIPEVTRAIKKIQRIMLVDVAPQMKQLMIEEYFALYNEAMTAWEESKRDEVTITATEKETEKGFESGSQTRTKGQVGNPAFLNSAANFLKQLRELEGMDSPKKVSLILEQEMRLILEFLEANIKEESYKDVLNAIMNYRSTDGEMVIDSEAEVLDD